MTTLFKLSPSAPFLINMIDCGPELCRMFLLGINTFGIISPKHIPGNIYFNKCQENARDVLRKNCYLQRPSPTIFAASQNTNFWYN